MTQKRKQNKTKLVLKHLLDGNSITSLEAIELFSATRLSSIIFTLRKRGYRISSVDTSITDKYGNACTFVRYILEDWDSQDNLFSNVGQKLPPNTKEYYKKETKGTYNRSFLERLWHKISSAGK